MPALAAKSAIVSKTLRGALVSRSNCSMRASMISTAGVTYVGRGEHVGERHVRAPAAACASTNASSTSTRGAMKRSIGIVAAGGEEHVVEQRRVIGLVDLRRLLHRARREADLAPLDHAPFGELASSPRRAGSRSRRRSSSRDVGARSGAAARAASARRAARRRARRWWPRRASRTIGRRTADAGCCAWRRTPARPRRSASVMPTGRLAKIEAKCVAHAAISASPVALHERALASRRDAHVQVDEGAVGRAVGDGERVRRIGQDARAADRKDALARAVALLDDHFGERLAERADPRLGVEIGGVVDDDVRHGRLLLDRHRRHRAADREDRDRRVEAELALRPALRPRRR